jgi:hypothetical protein
MNFVLVQWLCAASLASALVSSTAAAQTPERPHVYTNEQYIDDLTRPLTLPLDNPKAMLAFILESISGEVKVYPTENYYYFNFHHRGTRYAGNIRLDAKDRDEGKLHFAYFVELTEWVKDDAINYKVFSKDDGVIVERIEPLRYRVTLGGRSVVFQLNDLSNVVPPKTALGPDDQYLGPVFDESGIRFFLIFNRKLKIFHYVLDETVPVADELFPAHFTNRILIGRRTGFAFYDEHRLKRKILIGVYEANSSVNNAFDGPFDQLPDNFIKGDELRDAIIAADPSQAGRIDRHGGSEDGASRYLIGPYIYYRDEQELMAFHECATNKQLPSDLYWACFVVAGEDGQETGDTPAAATDKDKPKGAPKTPPKAAPAPKKGAKRP